MKINRLLEITLILPGLGGGDIAAARGTPAGKNFLIEQSKRRMVAEDISEALKLPQ